MVSLAGRTAIVTGAGRGLGRAYALRFAELGANVVVNDVGAGPDGDGVDGALAQRVVDEIVAHGGEAVAHFGSVSDDQCAKDLVASTVERFGGLDILINNAGILRDNTIVRMSEAEWDAVIDVHLKGHYTMLHHAAGYWRECSKIGNDIRASVVNTSSASGLRGNPGQLNYAAAKAGIAAMTLVAAQELERYGVRVNAIAPVARTRLTLQTPGWDEKLRVKEGNFDPWAPENITPLVTWLASDSSEITGQVFNVLGSHIGWNDGWTERIALNQPEGRAWTEDEIGSAMSSAGVPTRYEPSTTLQGPQHQEAQRGA